VDVTVPLPEHMKTSFSLFGFGEGLASEPAF